MSEVRNSDQKVVQKYLISEMFYGRQEVHKYLSYPEILLYLSHVYIILSLLHMSCATAINTLKKKLRTDRTWHSYVDINSSGCYIGYEPARGTPRINGALPFPNLS